MKLDLAKAVDFRKRAASQGHALSQHRLGMMYWGGQGVPQSDRECRELWFSAARAGLAAAQFSLGMCFANGYIGLDRDDAEAERWYERAALQRHAEAAEVLTTWRAKGYWI